MAVKVENHTLQEMQRKIPQTPKGMKNDCPQDMKPNKNWSKCRVEINTNERA